MPDAALPQWRDKARANRVAVFALDDGERFTADILKLDNGWGELILDVVPSNRPYPDSDQRRRAIPLSRVVSCEPLSREEQPWPFSDPCRRVHSSLARIVLMAALFLCMTVGSLPLYVVLTDRPFGIQGASAIAYTLFAVFFTFGAWRRFRPYRFTCPAVRTQFPRLVWRHLGFLVALFAVQTAALAVRLNLPDWWNTATGHGRHGDMPPFVFTLMLLCLGLGYAQVFTNRSLLDRAHRDFKT